MSDPARSHRLEGLEPDNLLAFLALLGLLRALETSDREMSEHEKLGARAAWDVENPPLRPVLHLRRDATACEVVERTAAGVQRLAQVHQFDGRLDLDYSRGECREALHIAATTARDESRERVDLFAALMTDAAMRNEKQDLVEPTPLCLLFGQGHQHFLQRLEAVPALDAPQPRGRKERVMSAEECLAAALLHPWARSDATSSFRWDPEEDVRYALMAGDPTDNAYKPGTQHGANRLAAVGLPVLTVVPEQQGTRVRAQILGGVRDRTGFSLAWPIWRDAVSLSAIRALLSHPNLRKPRALAHLGVEEVLIARRISVGQYVNFSRARPVRC